MLNRRKTDDISNQNLWVFAGPEISGLLIWVVGYEDLKICFFQIQLKCCDPFETSIHSNKIIFGQAKVGLSVINHHKHKKSSRFHQALVSNIFDSQLLETCTWHFFDVRSVRGSRGPKHPKTSVLRRGEVDTNWVRKEHFRKVNKW